jgi:hypothetical protein
MIANWRGGWLFCFFLACLTTPPFLGFFNGDLRAADNGELSVKLLTNLMNDILLVYYLYIVVIQNYYELEETYFL